MHMPQEKIREKQESETTISIVESSSVGLH